MSPEGIEILKDEIREYSETNPIRKLVDKILFVDSKEEIDLIVIFFAVLEGRYSFIGILYIEKDQPVNVNEKPENIDMTESEMGHFREIIEKSLVTEEAQHGDVALFELRKK